MKNKFKKFYHIKIMLTNKTTFNIAQALKLHGQMWFNAEILAFVLGGPQVLIML